MHYRNNGEAILVFRSFRLFPKALAAFLFITAPASAYEIALIGTWRGDEAPMTPADDWWGVFPEGEGYAIHPTRPSIVPTPEPEDAGASTTVSKKISLSDGAQPLFLVRGLKKPKGGPLRTAVESSDGSWVRDVKDMNRYINPGETLHLNLEGAEREDRIRLSAMAEIREEPEFHQILTYNYQLRLYQGLEDKTRSQTLFEHPQIRDLGHPHLEWAGDLDGDGKMDFLFDISDHYIQTYLVLYLSSEAKEGEMVARVATWRRNAC